MATWIGLGNGNWSTAANWLFFTLPDPNTVADISSGNVTVDVGNAAAAVVTLSGSKMVDVSGAGHALAVGSIFSIASGSTVLARNSGAISSPVFNVSGNLVLGGLIAAENAGTLTGVVNMSSTGQLAFNTLDNMTFGNAIIGSGVVTKLGASTVTLSAANSYSGQTNIGAGTLRISHNTALGSTTGGTTVSSGAALEVLNDITVGAEAITLSGTGIANGGALRNISGSNYINGPIFLNAATRINSDSGSLTLASIGSTNQSLTIGGSGSVRISGSIDLGSGSLSKDGSGGLFLSSANTYTGVTTITSGYIDISHGSALGSTAGGTVVMAGAALYLEFGVTVGAEALTLNGSGLFNDGALRNLYGNSTYGGAITLGSASRINSDFDQLSLNGTITNNGNLLTLGGNGTILINGAISGLGGVTKDGSGVLALFGANTFTGNFTINDDGVAQLNGGAALADTVNVSVNSLGRLEVNNSETIGSLAGLGSVLMNADLTVGTNHASTVFSGELSGNGALTKIGGGTLELSGTNTYTGTTRVDAGTLLLSGGAAIADTGDVVINAAGILQVTASETIGSLAGSGTVAIGPSITLTTGENHASTTFSGSLSGTNGAFTKEGEGTLTLSGINAYTGVTRINAGSLVLSGGSAIADTAGVVVNFSSNLTLLSSETIRSLSGSFGSTVTLNANRLTVGETGNYHGVISGTGGLTKLGLGTLTLDNVSTYTGDTLLSGGTLALTGAGSIASSYVNMTGTSTFDISGTTSGTTIKDLFGGGAGVKQIILGGKALTVTDAFSSVGTLQVVGGAGADALNFTAIASSLNLTLVGLTFSTWDSATDTITLNGNANSNTLTGSSQADTINGLIGNDTLNGGLGNDTLDGGVGADTLNGGGDWDTAFYGNATAGVVVGLSGWTNFGDAAGDTFTGIEGIFATAFNDYVGGDGNSNALYGNGGIDVLYGYGGIDYLYGGEGEDALFGGTEGDLLDGGNGWDTARYDDAATGVVVGLSGWTNFGEAAGDTFVSIEAIYATNFADYLGGDGNSNALYGRGGNDTLYGYGGVDYLYGGENDDILDGGANGDLLDGENGIDTASYATATGSVTAGLSGWTNFGDAAGDTYVSIENLTGSGFNDSLGGNSGVNRIEGGAGNDTILGYEGDDVLVGGSGNDEFQWWAGSGNDFIADFEAGAATGDVLRLFGTSFTSFAQLMATPGAVVQTAGQPQTEIHIGTEIIYLWGVTPGQLNANDFLFA